MIFAMRAMNDDSKTHPLHIQLIIKIRNIDVKFS